VNQILTAKPGDDKYEEKHEIYDALTLEFFQLTNSAPQAKQMLLQYIYDFITDNTSLTMEQLGLENPMDVRTELRREQLMYSDPTERAKLALEFQQIRDAPTWNAEFESAFAMLKTLDAQGGGFMAIEGAGGMGKTYLTNALVKHYRAEGRIARIAAPTALAATLYEGGMTLHDLFKLNVVKSADDEYVSFVQKHPQRKELLQHCALIMIDEAYNCHINNIAAMIDALQAICETDHPTAHKIICFIGDKHQIAPIVNDDPSERAAFEASILNLPNYAQIPKIKLKVAYRNKDDTELATFVETVAVGRVEPHHLTENGTPMIPLPAALVRPFTNENDALDFFMNTTAQRAQFGNKAIICADNNRVDVLNEQIQSLRVANTSTLCSCDYLKDAKNDNLDLNSTPEYLHGLNPKDAPPHALKLGVGDIVFLMRNLNKKHRLTNNTRVEVIAVGTRYITVQTLGTNRQVHLIPRINFTFKMNRSSPIIVNRLQFPLRLAYAITFNKAQGQTLDKVLLDARTRKHRHHESHGAFTHGQLYVALSRVQTRASIAILVDPRNLIKDPTNGEDTAVTANVVFKSFVNAS
jgi:tRNA A37 threonylcarbamoyladenosine biosynthesis protein TsaE